MNKALNTLNTTPFESESAAADDERFSGDRAEAIYRSQEARAGTTYTPRGLVYGIGR